MREQLVDPQFLQYDSFFKVLLIVIFLGVGIFSIFWIIQLSLRMEGSRLQKQGVKSVGFVQQFKELDSPFSKQPKIAFVLKVMDEHQQFMPAIVQTYIPRNELQQIRLGTPLPIIYDPKKPKKIAIDPIPDYELLQDQVDYYEAQQPESTLSYEERLQLRKNGKKSKALIRNIHLTGQLKNDKKETMLLVEFVQSQQKIKVQRTLYLTDEQLQTIRVGQIVEMTYLPENLTVFLIKISRNNFL